MLEKCVHNETKVPKYNDQL